MAANFFYALARVLEIAINVLIWLIIARALISWSPIGRSAFLAQVGQFLYWTTEPFLFPIRRFLWRFLPPAGLDLSPMIAILLLIFLKYFVVRSLYQLAFRL